MRPAHKAFLQSPLVVLKAGEFNVKDGIQFKSDITDGCYLESLIKNRLAVATTVRYKALV